LKLLASNVIENEQRLLELAYNSVRKRVADVLLRLQERYKEEDEKFFTMAVPRDDLASMVGTAKETVIRTLSDFKAEGLIEIHGSKITIKKTEELESMLKVRYKNIVKNYQKKLASPPKIGSNANFLTMKQLNNFLNPFNNHRTRSAAAITNRSQTIFSTFLMQHIHQSCHDSRTRRT
jgi:hypothetical protein